MSKISSIIKNNKRKLLSDNLNDYRISLVQKLKNNKLSMKERLIAQKKLDETSSSSRVKVNLRCVVTGRARSVSKYFHLSRHILREKIEKGYFCGIRKSS